MKEEIIRVFFDSNPALSSAEEKNNEIIINLLNKHGCNVIQTVMGTDWDDTNLHGKKAAYNIYASKLKDIQKCDTFVCEMSVVSASLVFEIFEALKANKPALVLYNERIRRNPDLALIGNPSNILSVRLYNESNLEEIITKFIKESSNKMPASRFTVRLSKEAGDYLNYLKVKMKLGSKNDVIVNLIEKLMREEPSPM